MAAELANYLHCRRTCISAWDDHPSRSESVAAGEKRIAHVTRITNRNKNIITYMCFKLSKGQSFNSPYQIIHAGDAKSTHRLIVSTEAREFVYTRLDYNKDNVLVGFMDPISVKEEQGMRQPHRDVKNNRRLLKMGSLPANMCNWATGGAQMGCHLGPKWAAHLGPS